MSANSRRFYLPTKVNFGRGSISELVKSIDPAEGLFLVTDPGVEKAGVLNTVMGSLEAAGARITVFKRVEPNPSAELVQEALSEIKQFGADKVIALGGGSSMDLGKVIAALATNAGGLEDYQWKGRPFEYAPLPFIAVPTTAGTGSEVTRVAVIVDRNIKKGINSDSLYPLQAIVDPELMVGLPPALTASTGMDALSHAVEAFVGLNANTFTDAFALEAVKLIGRSLVKACTKGSDLQAREDMALASTLAGIAMDQAGLGIVHSMASPFCGVFHLPHGEANAVLLKYGMSFNLKAAPDRYASLAVALGGHRAGMGVLEAAEAAVEAVARMVSETGLKVNLHDYGLKAEDADMVADQTMKMFLLKNNPYMPSFEDCKQLYLKVLAGENVI